ncbi:MAG: V-type proton ATPase subunit E [Oscillospiraceae bacterium]|nr:V-type proton ATPase subunit E [Oscillospiraceae bacterium]
MNGIEKIIARIDSEARSEVEAVSADAQKQCEEIKEKYDKAAKDEYWKIVKAGVKTCELHIQRMSKTAAMESKKSVLSLKQEMVSLAFEKAKELIRAFPSDRYTDFLAGMATQAAVTGSEEIILNESDRKQFGDETVRKANAMLKAKGLPGKLVLSKVTKPILGGVTVKSGDIEVNCSIEVLAELCRNDLAPQVAEIMFDEGR